MRISINFSRSRAVVDLDPMDNSIPTTNIRDAVRPWLDLIDTLRSQGVQQVSENELTLVFFACLILSRPDIHDHLGVLYVCRISHFPKLP